MNAQGEVDLLIRVTSQLAQKMLETGGLMHFGAVLGAKRDIQVLMPKSMKEKVVWSELEAYWKREIGKAASNGDWRAIACCTFVTELSDDDSEVGPALLIHVEHFDRNVDAEHISYRYQGDQESKITFGKITRATANRWLSRTTADSQTEQSG